MDELTLNPELGERINTAIESSNKLDTFLARAEMAGIDVSTQKKVNAEYRQKLLRIRQGFFPNQL